MCLYHREREGVFYEGRQEGDGDKAVQGPGSYVNNFSVCPKTLGIPGKVLVAGEQICILIWIQSSNRSR